MKRKNLKQMTDQELHDLMYKRLRRLWRRLPDYMVFRPDGSAILDGLFDMAKAELERRKK